MRISPRFMERISPIPEWMRGLIGGDIAAFALTDDDNADERYYLRIRSAHPLQEGGRPDKFSFPLLLEEVHQGEYSYICELLGEERGEKEEEEGKWSREELRVFRTPSGVFLLSEVGYPRLEDMSVEARGLYDFFLPLYLLRGGYLHIRTHARARLRCPRFHTPYREEREPKGAEELIEFFGFLKWELVEARVELPFAVYVEYYAECGFWSPLSGSETITAAFHDKVVEVEGRGIITEIR